MPGFINDHRYDGNQPDAEIHGDNDGYYQDRFSQAAPRNVSQPVQVEPVDYAKNETNQGIKKETTFGFIHIGSLSEVRSSRNPSPK
jgi:hypothetical protein